MPSVPTGSVTSSVITADTLHSSMAVTCCSRALELKKDGQASCHTRRIGKGLLKCEHSTHLFFPEYHSMKNQCSTSGNMAMKPR